MSHCRADFPNRCCHLTSRAARCAFEGVQAANLRNWGSVPNRWLGGSVVRWLGSCANPQPETHTSRPENEGLVPKAPILKYRIIHKGRANIMQIACAVTGSVPRFLVQKYRKELAVWLGDPKLDLAHEFKEVGTWNGEVTVDCCDKGKGGDK